MTSLHAVTGRKLTPRRVSQRHDADERQAERAAEVVSRGGSVVGWSFGSVAANTEIHRQQVFIEKTDEEKKQEAISKTAEALQETPQAQALKARIMADPVVKAVKDAVTSTPGIIATGAAAAGGVGALAATGKPLPIQPPEIPLDKITPGLSAKVTYEGPVNAPTFVGLTITYKEQGPKGAKRTAESDKVAADIARLKREQEMFKPAAQKKQEQELVDAWIRSQAGVLPGLTIPLKGTAKPEEEPKKKEETRKAPVQPSPASPSAETPMVADVDDALATPGRPLDPRTRRTMEARFGYDFSGVRVHADPTAATTARSIDAAAFTVGDEIAFAPGHYDPGSAAGERLLAHELAHVVQQSGGGRGGSIPMAYARGDHSRAARLVRSRKGAGVNLPPRLGRSLGAHIGQDLGSVRIHTDSFARTTAADLGANAFTVGNDIFFGPRMYAPERPDGLLRLAHELAHTVQQQGLRPVEEVGEQALEAEADTAVIRGALRPAARVGPAVLLEPTYPRRSTSSTMIREAERILTTTRNPAAIDATTRLWSRVESNFDGSVTAGTIARRVWTFIFLRHFTETGARPGVESVHPRYLYSHTYGWIDGQHFFGFIDFAEQQLVADPDREAAFRAATQQGVDIEAKQQEVREKLIRVRPPATGPERLMQVQPPGTPAFQAPHLGGGAAAQAMQSAAQAAATVYGLWFGGLSGTQRELFALLDEQQTQKFYLDSAKSAWSYEDIVSNQLGIRFFFQHGRKINKLPPPAREPEFLSALATFFTGISVEDDQGRLDALARSLPMQERFDRPTTTEQRERRAHPELFSLPPP